VSRWGFYYAKFGREGESITNDLAPPNYDSLERYRVGANTGNGYALNPIRLNAVA